MGFSVVARALAIVVALVVIGQTMLGHAFGEQHSAGLLAIAAAAFSVGFLTRSWWALPAALVPAAVYLPVQDQGTPPIWLVGGAVGGIGVLVCVFLGVAAVKLAERSDV
jgi:hypothetical protein